MSGASYIRREKLAAELRAQEAIVELEKLILKRLEVEKASLDGLADDDCGEQAVNKADGKTVYERVNHWITRKNHKSRRSLDCYTHRDIWSPKKQLPLYHHVYKLRSEVM